VATFQAVKKWKDDIDNKVTLPNGKRLPVILLANKVYHYNYYKFKFATVMFLIAIIYNR